MPARDILIMIFVLLILVYCLFVACCLLLVRCLLFVEFNRLAMQFQKHANWTALMQVIVCQTSCPTVYEFTLLTPLASSFQDLNEIIPRDST